MAWGAAPLPQSLADCLVLTRAQAELLSALQAQAHLLQQRVNLNSRNSAKPPSSDGPGAGKRAQRRASQRKRGAQPGHQGHRRAMLDAAEVDSIVDCKPEPMGECGAPVQLADEPQRHQVFDLPPWRARVDEYRLAAVGAGAAASPTRARGRPACPRVTSWSTLRETRAVQQRVTTTLQRRDGRTVHVRQATRPEPQQHQLNTILGSSANPGGSHRVLV